MFKETTTLYIPEDVAVAGGTDAIVCVYITVVYITCRRKWITHGWEDAERESIESGQQQREEREREKSSI